MMYIMHKSAKKQNVVNGLKSARSVGMNFIANSMIGYPGESEETVTETIEFCREQELVALPTYVTLFPNSKIFHQFLPQMSDWSSYFGKLGRIDFTRRPFRNLTELSEGQLISLRNTLVSENLAYSLVGKNRKVLAMIFSKLLKLGLILMDHAPQKIGRAHV